jgi:BlaI family penicillinase repressor
VPVRRAARSPLARADDSVLPEAEMEVLCVLHARGEAEAREVRDALSPYRPMTHASVLTLLGRLVAKGLVWRQKGTVGKAYVYGARRSAGQVYGGLLRRILRRVFANDPARLVASLLEARRPTDHELGQIRALIDDMGRRRGRR